MRTQTNLFAAFKPGLLAILTIVTTGLLLGSPLLWTRSEAKSGPAPLKDAGAVEAENFLRSHRAAANSTTAQAPGGLGSDPVCPDNPTWGERARQVPSDGGQGDIFGFSVAVDDDTAVVGSGGHDTSAGTNVGAAYVYVRSGGVWTFQQKLLASDGTGDNIFGDQFGTAVAISGDTIIVGANQDDTPVGVNSGSAYIFTRSGGVWTERQILTASAGNPGAAFGTSVAIEGDTAIVGSMWEDSSSGTNAGAAYVFKRIGSGWVEQQRLNSPDSGDGMLFGISVAISGQYIVVGSHVGAYLFYRSIPNWIYAQKWQGLDAGPDDWFGHSVAVSGDYAVVGAPVDDTAAGVDAGSAYMFQIRNGLEPIQQKVNASNGIERARYGFAVAINGNTALIGSYNGNSNEPRTGAAYVLERNGSTWEQRQLLNGSDNGTNGGFGIGLALSADTAIVGAYQHSFLNPSGITIISGGSYIFDKACLVPLFAPSVTPPAAQTVNAGSPVSFALGSFSDQDGGPWTAIVNWGDGSANTTFGIASAGTIPAQTHTYARAGIYTMSVTVTDSTGLFDTENSTVRALNVPPTIAAASDVTRTPGFAPSILHIATVNDPSDPASELSVTVNGSSTATVNGVTVSGITLNAKGQVSASIAAACGATDASFTLLVTDPGSLFATTTLKVTFHRGPWDKHCTG